MNGQTDTTPYRVLARKYRPINFDELIGQEALVRTLTNSINSGRLAHAFILTGVRGVELRKGVPPSQRTPGDYPG